MYVGINLFHDPGRSSYYTAWNDIGDECTRILPSAWRHWGNLSPDYKAGCYPLNRNIRTSLVFLVRTAINFTQNFIKYFSLKVTSIYGWNYLGSSDIDYWSDLLHLSDTAEKMRVQWDSTWTIWDFKKVYDSVRTKVLYNILTDFGVLMELVRLSDMYLN
jgi:hypothetical protein